MTKIDDLQEYIRYREYHEDDYAYAFWRVVGYSDCLREHSVKRIKYRPFSGKRRKR